MIEVAVIVLKTYGNRTLLLQRAQTAIFSLKWCHPGGKLNVNEPPLDAAMRELVEETGLVIPADLFIKYAERTIADHHFHYFAIHGEWPIQDIILNFKEHCGFGWFNSNEMLHLSMTEPSRYA